MITTELLFQISTPEFHVGVAVQGSAKPTCVVLQTGGEPNAFRRWPTRIANVLAAQFGHVVEDLEFVLIEPVVMSGKTLNQCIAAKQMTAHDGVRFFRFLPLFRSHMLVSVARVVDEMIGEVRQSTTAV